MHHSPNPWTVERGSKAKRGMGLGSSVPYHSLIIRMKIGKGGSSLGSEGGTKMLDENKKPEKKPAPTIKVLGLMVESGNRAKTETTPGLNFYNLAKREKCNIFGLC